MFKTLFKVYLGAYFAGMYAKKGLKGNKKPGKQSTGMKVLLGILFAYVAVVMLIFIFGLASGLGMLVLGTADEWFFFAAAVVIAFAICTLMSIFSSKAQMFEAKDNELLLSMPISPKTIVGVRVSVLVFLNLIYASIVFIPFGVAYCVLSQTLDISVTVLGVISYIITAVFVTLFATAVACLLGWLVAAVTARAKNKTLVTTLFLFSFIGLYLWGYFSLMASDMQEALADIAASAASIGSSFAPLMWIGKGACASSIWGILFTVAVCGIVSLLVFFAVSANFNSITRAKTVSRTISANKVKVGEKVSSPRSALLRKEFARIFSLPEYIVNCSLGAIMLPVLSIVAALNVSALNDVVSELGDLSGIIPVILCIAVCFIVSMTQTTSVSISIEGSRFALLKSFPVDPGDVLLAKLLPNIIIMLPSIAIADTILIVVFGFSAFTAVMLVLASLLFNIFVSLWGLCSNLWLPRFDWISETYAIKQGISVLLGLLVPIFGGIGIAVAAVFMSMASTVLAFIFIALVWILADAVLAVYLFTAGKRRFERIQV